MNDLTKTTDLRVLSLSVASAIEDFAEMYPEGEPAVKWLNLTARRLKRSYASSRPVQKRVILEAIAGGSRKIPEFVDELGFSRREVLVALAELVEDGFVVRTTVPAIGNDGRGRRSNWYELTDKTDFLKKTE